MSLPNGDETRSRICVLVEEFPEATATLTAGLHLKLEVRQKTFGWFMEDHHEDGRLALNCKALPGVAIAKVQENSTVFHIPKYVGHRGWIGVWLDVEGVDWADVGDLLHDGYMMSTPKSMHRGQPDSRLKAPDGN